MSSSSAESISHARLGDVELWVQLRAPRLAHAVDRPEAAQRREVRGLRRMPIPGIHHEGTCPARLADFAVGDRHHLFAVAHVKASPRVSEVVLDIHHEQRRPPVIASGLRHRPTPDLLVAPSVPRHPIPTTTNSQQHFAVGAATSPVRRTDEAHESDGSLVSRAANQRLSFSRRAAVSKVASATITGTGISIHS